MPRIRTVAALTAAAALAAPAAASAHVTVNPPRPHPGSFSLLTVRVPTERDDKGTNKVVVNLPDGFFFLLLKKVPAGIVPTKTKLDKPVDLGGSPPTRSSREGRRRRSPRRRPPGQSRVPLSVRIPDGKRATSSPSLRPDLPGRRDRPLDRRAELRHARPARRPPAPSPAPRHWSARPRRCSAESPRPQSPPSRTAPHRLGRPCRPPSARPAPCGSHRPPRPCSPPACPSPMEQRPTRSSTRSATGRAAAKASSMRRASPPMVTSARGRMARPPARAIVCGE